MNINMIRDADNDAGFYAAACASDPLATWGGAALFSSGDGGATYANLASLPNESVMGYTTNVLADFHGGNVRDELSSVNVALANGSLSSTSSSGLLSGANACVIGSEIVFFRDATLQANGSYTLRGFLRGRRGSEYAMAGHVAAERFVLFNVATMVRVAQSTSDIGIARLFKAVSAGATVAGAASQSFTNQGAGLKPYAPVHLGGGRNAAGDVSLLWVRRGRISGELRDSVDVPLSEASEAYTVEIWDSGFTTLKRTISGLTSPSAGYTAAQQTTDFGSPQASVYFRVYQLSAIVGRGYAASGSV